MQLIIISKTNQGYTAKLTNNQPAKIKKSITNYLDRLIGKELQIQR